MEEKRDESREEVRSGRRRLELGEDIRKMSRDVDQELRLCL